jgi:uncharacterized protein (TIGR00288 family)
MTTQPHAHLARPAFKEPPAHAPNAALLIDFDNVTMGIRSDLQSELKRLLQSEIIRGKVAVQRAYADWRRYPQYIVPLSESSIDLIFAPAYGSSKKNATDIRLAIDALELIFTRPEIGTFILLSGDSDFSSLVLKLKEYGKYVIGVGIRESSSDLLIQNCDEYFSYNELAGLTKESEVEYVRRDPWELVVEAVKQMAAHNDVMRSDRLKQVMQEIDPGFDEKDAGFSRFSKFVQECAHRGLIAIQRLDNGQYEISLGSKVEPPAPTREPRGRKSSIVGDAFGLLKQALGRMSGEQAVSAEDVREAMNELVPEGSSPVESRTMPKLLRQAHDAELIDLTRNDEGAYAVRLRQEAAALEPSGAAPTPAPPPAPAGEPEPEEEEFEPPMPASSAPPPPYSQPVTGPSGVPARSARFRRGSRGPRPAGPAAPRVGVVEIDPNYRARPEALPPRQGPPPTGGKTATPLTGTRDDEEERPRRARGGRGRGGRSRSGGNEPPDGRENRASHGRSESAEPRSSRGRRGGRGRGGGGRHRGERESGTATAAPAASNSVPAARSDPTPAPAPSREPVTKEEGDSFWSRVKRGLIGGE